MNDTGLHSSKYGMNGAIAIFGAECVKASSSLF
jgi:hypothetical protein